MQKITPCLWFDNQAEEAANFYTSLFKHSKINQIMYYDEAGAKVSGKPAGSVMTCSFELEGQEFLALNGGSVFQLSPAISFIVNCETQEEVDFYWEKLSEGGEKGQCGWINKDKFGITWQIVPTILNRFLSDKDSKKAQRVMKAMLQMNKIDIDTLKKAYENKE